MTARDSGSLSRRLPRAALALGLALSIAGLGRLATPGATLAIECALLPPPPLAIDDPSPPVSWEILEDDLPRAFSPSVLANDGCSDGASVVSYTPVGATFNVDSGGNILLMTPDPDFAGTASFGYNFYGGTWGTSTTGHARFTVIPVNDRPAYGQLAGATCGPRTVAEDSGSFFDSTCTYRAAPGGGVDEQLQGLNPHATTNHPELFSSLSNDPDDAGYYQIYTNLHFTPAPNANGSATITFWATDTGGTANGGVDTSLKFTTTVTITPVDDPPNAVSDAFSTGFGQALVVPSSSGILKNDTDIDGPTLTAARVSGPAHGVLGLQPDGSFIYTPVPGFSGQDSFIYRATSGSLSDTATVTLGIGQPAATPAATEAPAPTQAASGEPGVSPSPEESLDPGVSPILVTAPPPSVTAAPFGPSPSGSGGPAVVPDSSGDLTPWLIGLIVGMLVIGVGVGIYQLRRGRRPEGGI